MRKHFVITGILAIVGITHTIFGAGADGPLSVDETVGVVFADRENKGGSWNFMSRANPDARPILYEILKNPSLIQHHPNAILLLGYTGDEADVGKLEDSVLGLRGEVTTEQKRSVMVVFDALGILARRGVKGARELLEKMCTRDYWADVRFVWYSGDVKPPGGAIPELVYWALRGYAKSEQDDLEKRVEAAVNSFKDPKVREYLKNRLSIDTLRLVARGTRKGEAWPIDPELRASLVQRWNRDPKDPQLRRLTSRSRTSKAGADNAKKPATAQGVSRTPSAVVWEEVTDGETVKNAFDESYRAYREIRAAVIAHEFEQIYGALLDNGRIVSVRRPKPVPEEYIRAIKQQRGILMNKLVSDAQADQVVVRTGSASNGKDQPERHSLQVKFRLKGTADIGGPLAAKISPQPRTIAEDGSLIVVMEKIGNKWYWEPFGW